MKKILTVLLAAAVIFGFAACSPSTVSYFGKDVLSITVASAPDLFAGETLNPADVQLRVVYDDHTEETFTGAQLGMERKGWTTGSAPFAMAEGANAFVVKYGVKTGADDVVVSKDSEITINTVSFHELVIDGSAVTSIDASDVSSMSDVLDKIAFTAYYNDGADSKPVSATLAQTLVPNLFGDIVTLVPVKGTEDQYEVTAAAGNKVTIDPEWIVTVTGMDEVTIKGVRVEQQEGNEIFNISAVPEASRDTLADVKYDVYAVYSDNTEKKLDPDTDYKADYKDYARYTFDGSANVQRDFVVEVTLSEDLGGDVFTDTLTVDFAEDYATKITATEKTNTLVKQGARISVTDFVFVVDEWKSGAEYEPKKELTSGIALDEDKMDFVLVPVGNTTEKAKVAFTYDANPDCSFNGGSEITVTVQKTESN